MVEHRVVWQKHQYIQSSYIILHGLLAWLTQRLSLCYLKSTLENGVGNQILLQMSYCFPTKSKNGNNFFPQIFSISDVPLWDESEISSENRGKVTPMSRAHSPNVTDQSSAVRPDKPRTRCMVWMCYVLYPWPFYSGTWARPESFWDML